MNIDHCIEHRNHAKTSCSDHGKSIVIVVDRAHRKIRVDGCVVQQQLGVDWIIECERAAIFIELKGKDVEHGADQVRETARLWRDMDRSEVFAGLIVARQYPRSRTAVQRRQQAFAREFKGPLHIVTKALELRFNHVLSFKGPLKE